MKGKKKFTLTRVFTFDSAHRLTDYQGKCSDLHGHTYKLEVSVAGHRDHRGMVFDFGELKTLVEGQVINRFDHGYLNDILDINPTAENICEWIWDTLEPLLLGKGCILARVRLWETPTSCCTLEKENG